MSRLPRYRLGSLVHHLIAIAILLAGGIFGAGEARSAYGDESADGSTCRFASSHTSAQACCFELSVVDTPAVSMLARLDTATPGARTYLAPNYPNPAISQTTFEFSLANEMVVSLTIHDFWYGVVKRLIVSETRLAGVHRVKWEFFPADEMVIFSGMYFITLRAGDEILQRRMMIMK